MNRTTFNQRVSLAMQAFLFAQFVIGGLLLLLTNHLAHTGTPFAQLAALYFMVGAAGMWASMLLAQWVVYRDPHRMGACAAVCLLVLLLVLVRLF